LLHIWRRNKTVQVPLMFCHVEGAEKALTVSTAEGSEQSRSNDAEKDEAVSMHLKLLQPRSIYELFILAQTLAKIPSRHASIIFFAITIKITLTFVAYQKSMATTLYYGIKLRLWLSCKLADKRSVA